MAGDADDDPADSANGCAPMTNAKRKNAPAPNGPPGVSHSPFTIHHSAFGVQRSPHAAILAGRPFGVPTLAVEAPPPLTPKLTTNSAASPAPVLRMPWIW